MLFGGHGFPLTLTLSPEGRGDYVVPIFNFLPNLLFFPLSGERARVRGEGLVAHIFLLL